MANVYEVVFDQVVVRVTPAIGSPVIDSRKKGELVEVDEWQNGWVHLAKRVRGEDGWMLLHHDSHGDLLSLIPPATFKVVLDKPVAVREAPSTGARPFGRRMPQDVVRVIGQMNGWVKLAGVTSQYMLVKHEEFGQLLEYEDGLVPFLQQPETKAPPGVKEAAARWNPPDGWTDVAVKTSAVSHEEMKVQLARVKALTAHAELNKKKLADEDAKQRNKVMMRLTGSVERSETGFYLGHDAM